MRFLGLFILIFGVIGNIFTILTLETTKQFYSNPFCVYTVVSIINSIFILITQLGLFILDTFLGYSPRATITWVCKLYAYINYFPVYVTITLLALASIDRWLSTCRNAQLRKYSSKRNAKVSIIFVILFFAIILIPHPIYTEIFYDPTRKTTRCNRPTRFYKIYTNHILAFNVHFIPLIVMIVFGYLTHCNLSMGYQTRRLRTLTIKERINIQMSRTLIIQVILFVICIVPNWIVNIVYPTFTSHIIDRSATRIAIEVFLSNFTMIIYDINFASAFYIFTFISPAFRRNFKQLFRLNNTSDQLDVSSDMF